MVSVYTNKHKYSAKTQIPEYSREHSYFQCYLCGAACGSETGGACKGEEGTIGLLPNTGDLGNVDDKDQCTKCGTLMPWFVKRPVKNFMYPFDRTCMQACTTGFYVKNRVPREEECGVCNQENC